MKSAIASWTVLTALPLFACASYPVPADHMTNSYANIRAAEEVGAASTPQAALYLRLAQEEQAKAKQLTEAGNNEQADTMTLRANADAEVAVALAREVTAKTKAASASAQVKAAARDSAIPPNAGSFSATTTTTSTTVPVNPSNGSK